MSNEPSQRKSNLYMADSITEAQAIMMTVMYENAKGIRDHVGDIHRMYKGFDNETDRSAIILSVSYLENALTAFLSDFLVKDKETDRLFKGYAPLSTFSAKIDIAFALGLIPRDMKADLNIIRRIRNHCAHKWQDIKFDSSPLSDLVDNLLLPSTYIFQRLSDEVIKENGIDPNNTTLCWALTIHHRTNEKGKYAVGNDLSVFNRRQQFIMAVSGIVNSIRWIGERTVPKEASTYDYRGTILD